MGSRSGLGRAGVVMVVDAILTVFKSAVNVIFGLLPGGAAPDMITAFSTSMPAAFGHPFGGFASFLGPIGGIVGGLVGKLFGPSEASKTRSARSQAILPENPHVKFHNGQRGYVRCAVGRDRWTTDYRVVPFVSRPGASVETRASLVLENGRPGIHHVAGRTIKDLICRFRALQGRHVTRIAGWDTHGLPVEIEVEKELGLDGKQAIEAFGVAEFNARARASVFRYQAEWQELSNRIGYWLDYEHPYVTCSNEYVESVWWLLKQLHEKGLLYPGHRVLPYCPRCATPLSSHEVGLGFQDDQDPSVFVRFALEDGSGSLLVWTTTPWTLPSNVAIAAGPDVDYVEVEVTEGPTAGERLWLAKPRLEALKAADDAELAGLAAKMDSEEAYHRMHAEMWVDRLLSSDDGRARLNEAVDELWPYALGVLDDELRPELRRRAEERLGRALPDVAPVTRGVHEAELAELWEEMTMVRRSAPAGARW